MTTNTITAPAKKTTVPPARWVGKDMGYSHPLEEFNTDGWISTVCPHCGGDERNMEPDASDIIACENCGEKYRFVSYC